jgi:hypothetical protein
MSDDVLHDLVLPKLDGVRKQGGYYMARCPAPDHEDRQASLSVSRGKEHPVVFNCHAGCDPRAIADAIGVPWDLLCKPRERPDKPTVVATYEYTDEQGRILFVKERRFPKDFRIRRPDGRGGWAWSLGDTRRVLYNLPRVVAAIKAGTTVYLVEGEKDVRAAERIGAVATCNFDGAAKEGQRAKWRPEYGDMLKGAHVVLVADNDEAGVAHARAALADLKSKAASVRAVRGLVDEPHADLSDHLDAGHTLDQLAPLDGEDTDPVDALIAELLDTGDLDNIPALEPLIADVLFRDTIARVWGESGSFKSFMVLDMAGSIGAGATWHGRAVQQGLVIYLVAEGIRGVRKRVRAWEQHHGQKMTGVKFLPRPVQVNSPEWRVFIEACRRLRPSLVIIDTQARVTVGVEENSAKEMGVVIELVEQARAACQACVLLVHHSGINGERGRGSTSIKGAVQTELGVSRSGKGLQDIRVTLRTGKQKDDEELDDIVFRLEQIQLAGEAHEDGRPVTSVVLISSAPLGPLPGSVEDAIAKLDQAKVPAEYGRRKARTEASKVHVVLPADSVLGPAIKQRQNRCPRWCPEWCCDLEKKRQDSTTQTEQQGGFSLSTAQDETTGQNGSAPLSTTQHQGETGGVVLGLPSLRGSTTPTPGTSTWPEGTVGAGENEAP